MSSRFERLEALVHQAAPWRCEPDAVELGWVLRRNAELHEQRGERQAAYSRLLDLWDDADARLEPILADSRARRAALAEEAAGE